MVHIWCGVCSEWLDGARWVEAAGARVRLGKGEEGVEVSPRVSYSGEGLAPLCRGRTLRSARDAFLQVRPGKIIQLLN